MARVVAWPGDEPGYINIHTFRADKKDPKSGREFMYGSPFRDLDALMDYVQQCVAQPGKHSAVYFCTSTQAEKKTITMQDGRSFDVAKRDKSKAKWLKSIWLDVDVGKKDGYPDEIEASKQISAFIQQAKLPLPTALVKTGGGLHVYWISDKRLSQPEWQGYADGLKEAAQQFGLKADLQCTADCARILRVPGTFNLKYGTPRPCKLLHMLPDNIDFATALAHIRKAVTATVTRRAPNEPDWLASVQGWKHVAAFGHLTDSLADGIDKREKLPLDPRPMFTQCQHFRETLRNGGKSDPEPLWMLNLLACTFIENGNNIAHMLSNKYPCYGEGEETKKKLAERYKYKAEKNLGWPSCTNFEAAGAHCQGCPLRGSIRSPLNLAIPVAPSCGLGQGNIANANGQPQQWPDPLDFTVVPEEEAIERVNAAGYFVLTLNGDIYKVQPGGGVVVQKREGFNNVFACRLAQLDDGQSISAGTAWRNSSKRCEYDEIGYWPDNHGRPPKSYNLWQRWGIEPVQGAWSIIFDHILHVLANGDKAKADYILDWCAHMVQRPWEKPGVALVFRGRKGTGKSLPTEILARAIGRQNALITADGKRLFGQFNWHLADKLLIGAEEAFFAGNREQNDKLKHLLTGPDIEVEQKYGQRIFMKSMHRMIMTSNHDQVIDASDDERRFLVCDVSERQRGNDAYFAPLVRVIKGQDDATLAAFMYELRTRDITKWQPEPAARKVAGRDLAAQKLLSLEPPLQWLLELAATAPSFAVQTQATGSSWQMKREDMLDGYRAWVKSVQVRGATEFTGAERFWASIKRLLNDGIFPNRRLFHSAGGKRFVALPRREELVDGFNRLLGGKVVDVDDAA